MSASIKSNPRNARRRERSNRRSARRPVLISQDRSSGSSKKGLRESPPAGTAARGDIWERREIAFAAPGRYFSMNRSRFALISALLLAGAAPILAQPAASGRSAASARRRPLRAVGRRSFRPRPGDQAGRRFLAPRQQHTGSAPIRSRPTAPPGASAPCSARMSRRRCAPSSRPPAAAPIRSAARSRRCTPPTWTKRASRRAALAPARPYLDRIAAAHAPATTCCACSRRRAIPRRSASASLPNPANPTHYIAFAGQAGLGMPNRDYYLREGADYDRFRAAYRDYMITLYRLASIAEPEARADRDHRAGAPHRRGALDAGAQPRHPPALSIR